MSSKIKLQDEARTGFDFMETIWIFTSILRKKITFDERFACCVRVSEKCLCVCFWKAGSESRHSNHVGVPLGRLERQSLAFCLTQGPQSGLWNWISWLHPPYTSLQGQHRLLLMLHIREPKASSPPQSMQILKIERKKIIQTILVLKYILAGFSCYFLPLYAHGGQFGRCNHGGILL